MSCYYFLASYEKPAKTTDRPGGALLAEILPLLPEGALQRALNPDDAEFLPLSSVGRCGKVGHEMNLD